MLIFDLVAIGNKLYTFRKRAGMTQAEVAEAAGISDRTYADIERGSANMRTETMLKICKVLSVTPNDILIEESGESMLGYGEIGEMLAHCSVKERETAMSLLTVYLNSLT